MKTPSFFELKTMVEYLNDELTGSQLQEVLTTEEGLVLGFYRFNREPKMQYLLFDLDKPFPIFVLLPDNPWSRFKKTKPVGLFLSSHAKNLLFSQALIVEKLGRVVTIELGEDQSKVSIEFRAIPKQTNLIVKCLQKSISWNPVKVLGEHDGSYSMPEKDEEVRSISFLTQQWRIQRGSFGAGTVKSSTKKETLSPFDKWVKARQKDLAKKTKALESISKQIRDFESEEWADVGEYLKSHSLNSVKPEWSIYIDYDISVSKNIQRCFEKAKAAKSKILGAQNRLELLRKEIHELQDISAKQFEQIQIKLSERAKAKAGTQRKVEGKLRKLELEDGAVVAYIGKSAADNLSLLRNAKPHDYWLHLKDYPSAHAVVHRPKNRNLGETTLQKLARWLAEESMNKSQSELGGKYAVVLAECRHVKPLKGDKLGRVTYHHAREFLIAL